MGKAALLFVAAGFVGAAFTMYGQQKASLQANTNQSEYQDALLARQTAESGLNMAMSKAKRDFDAWRVGYDQAHFDGGDFDVAVQGTAAGPVTLTATGTFSGAEHRVRATLARLAPTPAALLIDADTVEASLSSNFIISGRDTRPRSGVYAEREGNGSGTYANGVWARGSEGRSAFQGAAAGLNAERVRGASDQSDIVQGTPEDLDAFAIPPGQLFGEAITQADASYPDGSVFNDETFGASGDPQIIVVDGSAIFSGETRGYGLLIVRGSAFFHDDFEWEGIVLAHRQEDDMDVTMTGNATIYGALIGRHGYITGSEEEEEEGDTCDYRNGGSGPVDGDHSDPAKPKKRLVCHFPPGNPANAHTISISVNAVQTHIDHHDDYDGPCSCGSGEGGGGTETVGSAGTLRFTMWNDAAIYYSTEAIGKLAARLPVVKQASWIVAFDKVGEDLGLTTGSAY